MSKSIEWISTIERQQQWHSVVNLFSFGCRCEIVNKNLVVCNWMWVASSGLQRYHWNSKLFGCRRKVVTMKTKLISMQWRGSASVDPRFSAAMLPWIIADIYNREQYTNVSTAGTGRVCFIKNGFDLSGAKSAASTVSRWTSNRHPYLIGTKNEFDFWLNGFLSELIMNTSSPST